MALTAWQEYISKRFPGKGQAPSQDQLAQLAQEFFGNIPLPPGVDESQVVSRRGDYVEWKDQDGYVHRLTRELDGRSPNAGRVSLSDQTNKPFVKEPSKEQQQSQRDLEGLATSLFQNRATQTPQQSGVQPWMDRLNEAISKLLSPAALAELDPAAAARLAEMKAAEDQALTQQFQEGQGNLIANLFGRGTNASSIAGQQAARLLQQQGLVKSQELANAAQRELAVRQFLTQTGQGNLALGLQGITSGGQLALEEFAQKNNMSLQEAQQMLSYLSSLQNQSLTRETSNAGFGLQSQQLGQQAQQFQDAQLQQYLQWQEQVRQMNRANQMNNIFRGIATGASLLAAPFTGGASLAGALGGLFKSRGSGNNAYSNMDYSNFGTWGNL